MIGSLQQQSEGASLGLLGGIALMETFIEVLYARLYTGSGVFYQLVLNLLATSKHLPTAWKLG